MKLEIKSVLIGVLLGINIMLLMGSAPAKKEVGRYMAVYNSEMNRIAIIDTTDGRIVNSKILGLDIVYPREY